MAVFDTESQKIVVRVVYDGPSGAGKSTNLSRLEEAFSESRRGKLIIPKSEGKLTSFFEWMDVDGGLVGGYRMRCQLVTTPGRATLSRRRRRVLARADVVVFVTDSTPEGLREGRRWMELLRASLSAEGREVAIVVQANKQDRPRALDVAKVAEALGLDASTNVVGAQAHDGKGVRETAMLGMRAAAAVAQKLLLERGVEALGGVPETPDSLAGAMLDDDRRGAEQAPGDDNDRPRGEKRKYDPAFDPALPHSELPTGFIWPGNRGREALRRVTDAAVGGDVDVVVDEGDERFVVRAGGLMLRTSGEHRFEDADEARAALLGLARKKTLLGRLWLSGGAVAVVPEHGGHRLWTVSPVVPTLQTSLDEAIAARDAGAAGHALARWAEGLIEAVVAAARVGATFDYRPARFAVVSGDVVYLDDGEVEQSSVIDAIGAEVERAAAFPSAVERLVGSLERELPGRLTASDCARLAEQGVLSRGRALGDGVEKRIAGVLAALSGAKQGAQ